MTRPSLAFMRSVALAGAVTCLVGAGLFGALNASDAKWLRGRPATCLSSHCFCEKVRTSIPRQPADTWSSLAYVFAGFVLMLRPLRQLLRTRRGVLTDLLAVLLVVIGIGSFVYHATLVFVGQFVDVFGMYLLGMLLICAALVRLRLVTARNAVLLYITSNTVLGFLQYAYPDLRRYLFALILIPGIIAEFLPRISIVPPSNRRPLQFGFLTLVVAYIFWLLDQNLVLCSGRSLLQGHALWHVLTAGAVLFLAAHYSQTAGGLEPRGTASESIA